MHNISDSFEITNLIFDASKGFLTFDYKTKDGDILSKNISGITTAEEIGEAVTNFIIKYII